LKKVSFLKLGAFVAMMAAAQASAGYVDIVGDYNILTFGDFTDNNDAVHGKLAAGGNVTLTHNAVNSDAPATEKITAIVSGGNVTASAQWGNQINGSVYAAKDVTIENVNVTGDVTAENITMINYGVNGTMNYTNSISATSGNKNKIEALPESPVDFAAKKAAADLLSANLAEVGTTNYKAEYGVLNFFDNDETSDINYYTINASDLNLSSISSLHFYNLNEKYIITIDGNGDDIVLNSINQKNYGTQTDINYSNLLFNFINTDDLKIGSFYGNILASNADVTAENGQMFGSMVANSFSGQYQFHQVVPYDFDPPPADVPESSTGLLMIAGFSAVLVASRKKMLKK
jgi:choice-of-anchor A domain-containing protein